MTPAPPPEAGLPPALGTVRGRRGDVLGLFALYAVVCAAYAAVRGAGWDDVPDLLPFVLVPAALVAVSVLRSQVTVGPGWAARRDLVRHRWVRTDRLVQVGESAQGRTDRGLDLVDADGRAVSLPVGELRREPRLLDQLRADVRRSLDGGASVDERAREHLGL